jgi:hypothetical protein
MSNDSLTQCNRCGGDACYTQKVTPELSTYWCYGCGFLSNDLMKEGEEYYNQQISTLPDLYLDLLYKDTEGKYWMPSTVNIPEQGMVFAQGTSALEWRWTAVKAIERTEEDKKKNPKNTSAWKMDMANQKFYNEKDYLEALDFIGVFKK